MKIITKFVGLIVISLVFCGCKSKDEVYAVNQQSLKHPEEVGEVNGQILYRAGVITTGNGYHWVYWLGSNSVVTVNRMDGKLQLVEVFIDGKRYISTEQK